MRVARPRAANAAELRVRARGPRRARRGRVAKTGVSGGDDAGAAPRRYDVAAYYDATVSGPWNASRRRAHVKCGDAGCVVHPLLYHCPADAGAAREACVWGGALGMSRALRFTRVAPELAALFCGVFPDAALAAACAEGLLGWTGTTDDPPHPYPALFERGEPRGR